MFSLLLPVIVLGILSWSVSVAFAPVLSDPMTYRYADFKMHFLANLDLYQFYDLVDGLNP